MNLLGLLVAAGAVVFVGAAHAGTLTVVGTLSVPGVSSQEQPGQVAVSGPTAVLAGPFGSTRSYVFTEPAGGWSSEDPAATLSETGPVAVSAQTVVMGQPKPQSGPEYLDVFTEPPSGWTGDVAPVARLMTSDGADLGRFGIAGRTVAAAGTNGTIYVFTEPSGGWQGIINESAKLRDSQGAYLVSVAISGQNIAATSDFRGPNRTDVFTEPAAGWVGTVHEAATLSNPFGGPTSPAEVSGSTIINWLSVFTEPRGGWRGTVGPSAQLSPHVPYDGNWFVPGATLDTQTAEVSGCALDVRGLCSCACTMWLFSEPPGGWHGIMVAEPVAALPGFLEDPWLFASAYGGKVQVYRLSGTFGHRIPPPRIRFASITGLAHRIPTLNLTIGASFVRSLLLKLPHGLSFNPGALRTWVSISGGAHSLSLVGGELLITYSAPSEQHRIDITVNPPAIRQSKDLHQRIIALVSYNRHHKHHRMLRLPIALHLSDPIGSTADRTTTIKVR